MIYHEAGRDIFFVWVRVCFWGQKDAFKYPISWHVLVSIFRKVFFRGQSESGTDTISREDTWRKICKAAMQRLFIPQREAVAYIYCLRGANTRYT